MKNSNLIPQRNPHRRVTTIYFPDGTPAIVEAVEWGGGSAPNLVCTLSGQIWRQGIDASWSSCPDQSVALSFLRLRQQALKSERLKFTLTN